MSFYDQVSMSWVHEESHYPGQGAIWVALHNKIDHIHTVPLNLWLHGVGNNQTCCQLVYMCIANQQHAPHIFKNVPMSCRAGNFESLHHSIVKIMPLPPLPPPPKPGNSLRRQNTDIFLVRYDSL